EVAQVDGESLVPDCTGRRPRAAEVHVLNETVCRQNLERSAIGRERGGVIADANRDPLARASAPRANAVDERVLSEVGDRRVGGKPRFAVWGGRMNLHKQVEPL